MKEFRIILATLALTPAVDTLALEHKYTRLRDAHLWLRRALITNFDGFTSYEATGAWRNDAGDIDREPVIVYDIAIEEFARNIRILTELAITACKRAHEDCVYFRDGDGNVELLRPPVESTEPSPAFPRKGGGTYRALDPVLHEDEARTRQQIREDKEL